MQNFSETLREQELPTSGKKNIIHTAVFKGSFVSEAQCPEPNIPEYAFIGRSNVGKSSLINMLTGRNALAHVSHTPGKTQAINFFLINAQWHLVDLPGYGYAKVSKTKRKDFEEMLRRYLQKRPNLVTVFLLIDSRIPPQDSDIAFANWLGEMNIPFIIIFTKTDDKKFKQANIQVFEKKMLETWEEMPRYFLSSARKNKGREELLSFINNTNEQLDNL